MGCSGTVGALSTEHPQSTANANAQQAELTSPLSDNPEIELDNFGPAPELNNKIWLNTDQPLRLVDLGGKVVLLEMWTFG
jgi:hypothetical protein